MYHVYLCKKLNNIICVGRILRTDVIADSISSLQILTKTHELYLEEAPEEFSVRAYDEHGNEFRFQKNL